MEMAIEVEWKDDKGKGQKARYEIVKKKWNLIRRLLNKLSNKWHEEFLLYAQYEQEMREDGQWHPGPGLTVRKWPEEITRVVVDDLLTCELHGNVNWHNKNQIMFSLAHSGGHLVIEGITQKKILLLPEGSLSKFLKQ